MPDREKVIKGLECCKQWSDAGIYEGYQPVICENCPRVELQMDVEECHEALLNDAIALLKLQESKPPIVKENSYGWKFYYCPSCGKEFYQNNKFSFCEKCGQAVKWDG